MSRSADIRRVQQEGKAVRTRSLSIRVCASPLGFPRVGIIVPRHGQSAVDRNRLKRRLREVFRRDVLPSERAIDVVVRASPAAYRLAFAELRAEVAGAVMRLAN